MKKIISILLILMLAVSVLASVTVVASAADDRKVVSWDFNEDWEDYKVASYLGRSGTYLQKNGGGSGDWQVHYERPNKELIEIINGDDPNATDEYGNTFGELAKGRGNVLLIDNLTVPGTYINIGYVGTNGGETLHARNFTIEYDIMPLMEDAPEGWMSFIARWATTDVHHVNSINITSTLCPTTGTGAETVTLSDGTTRPSRGSDYAFWTRSSTGSGTGTSQMAYESGITRVSDYYFRTDGGGLQYTWFTVRIEAKDGYFTIYIKETCGDDCEAECSKHRWVDTGTRVYTDIQNIIYSGTIGFGQCITRCLYDNIKFKSNDSNALSIAQATDSNGAEVCRARVMSSTASDGSNIELISEIEAGYVFDKWYKDAEKQNAVTPVEFVLQEHVLNERFGLYDWEEVVGATDGIKTWEDLETKKVFVKDGEIVEEGTDGAEEMPWRDFYATSADRKFRLITRVITGPSGDGYNFYSTAVLKEYKVKIYSNDETKGQVAIQGVVGDTGRFSLIDSGLMVATPLEGFEFAGWYKEVKGKNPDDQGGIKNQTFTLKVSDSANFDFALDAPADAVYKAVFVPETSATTTLNITLVSTSPTATGDQTGSVTTLYGEATTYREGEKVSLIAEAKDGYAFVGWKYDDAPANEYFSTEPYYDYTIKADQNNISAVFEIETFRIFVVDGIGSPEVERTAKSNSRITLYPATAPTGYTFSSWLVTGIAPTDWSQDETGKLELNVTSRTIRVQARFVKITHRVRIQANDSDFGSALGGGTKAVGDTVTITPSPKAGYSIVRYVVRGVDATINPDGTLSFTMPDDDVIVRVEFGKIDKIDVGAEITMYVIFSIVGLAIVASILFANNKDKRDRA